MKTDEMILKLIGREHGTARIRQEDNIKIDLINMWSGLK
jgi:hypothetical protein